MKEELAYDTNTDINRQKTLPMEHPDNTPKWWLKSIERSSDEKYYYIDKTDVLQSIVPPRILFGIFISDIEKAKALWAIIWLIQYALRKDPTIRRFVFSKELFLKIWLIRNINDKDMHALMKEFCLVAFPYPGQPPLVEWSQERIQILCRAVFHPTHYRTHEAFLDLSIPENAVPKILNETPILTNLSSSDIEIIHHNTLDSSNQATSSTINTVLQDTLTQTPESNNMTDKEKEYLIKQYTDGALVRASLHFIVKHDPETAKYLREKGLFEMAKEAIKEVIKTIYRNSGIQLEMLENSAD